MQEILVIHGPNLNALGKRAPDIYGKMTLDEINSKLKAYAQTKGIKITIEQSNREGDIIDLIQRAFDIDGIIINPAAYTHTSIGIRDAIETCDVKAIEVHISNIYAREDFRKTSVIAPVCIGQVSGLGWLSYLLALDFFVLNSEIS